MSVVMREYVDHLMDKHQKSGTIGQALKKLREKIKRDLGPCKPDYPDGLPGPPLDEKKLETWGDLCFVHGVLQTGAIAYMDCQACMKNVKPIPK